jgi:hypothetical protein
MLEHIGSGIDDLYDDLTIGMNSSWQEYTLAFPNQPDNGAQYIGITDPTMPSPVVSVTSRAKLLRQYFKFVRAGAVRFAATSTNGALLPTAFRNKNGKVVVVVKTSAAATFSIGYLPAATYGIKYTTNAAYDQNLADQVVTAGQKVSTTIPAAGVLTVYAR